MCLHLGLILAVFSVGAALAGPVDFGKQEFGRAVAERKLAASRFRIQTEVSGDAPESFRIEGARVSGGDLRGLMYGLLEAAEQIRAQGRLTAVKRSATVGIRALRLPVDAAGLASAEFGSPAHWDEWFEAMARARFNRLSLFLEEGAVVTDRARGTLQMISERAAGFVVDLAISLSPDALPGGPEELRDLLAACSQVRAVAVRAGAGGKASPDALVRVVADAGRRVVLEVRRSEVTPGLLGEVADTGVPWRVIAGYDGGAAPAAPEGVDEVLWDLGPAGGAGGGEPGDPVSIRQTVKSMAATRASGFVLEIRSPEDLKEPWLARWGRMGYDPAWYKEPAKPVPAKKK